MPLFLFIKIIFYIKKSLTLISYASTI